MNITVSADNAGTRIIKEMEELFPGVFEAINQDTERQIQKSEMSDLFIQHHIADIRMGILNMVAEMSESQPKKPGDKNAADGDSTVIMFIFLEALRMYTLIRARKHFIHFREATAGDTKEHVVIDTMAAMYMSDSMKNTIDDIAKIVDPAASVVMRDIINSVQKRIFG